MGERLKGRRRMRFVGYKDGRLIPRAPGSYKQGEIYLMPPRQANYPWWELMEELPPDEISEDITEESVFEPEKTEKIVEEEIIEESEKAEKKLIEDEETVKPKSLEKLNKKELIEYIRSTGAKANLSMRKRELRKRASERGYPSS